MKRYEVTFFDDFTGKNISIEYIAPSARAARHECYSDCGDVEILDTRKISE